MDHGFLRWEVRLIKADGTEEVLEKEATGHRCGILQNRLEHLKKCGYDGKLKFRISKLLDRLSNN